MSMKIIASETAGSSTGHIIDAISFPFLVDSLQSLISGQEKMLILQLPEFIIMASIIHFNSQQLHEAALVYILHTEETTVQEYYCPKVTQFVISKARIQTHHIRLASYTSECVRGA